jgi:hypothetical protein
MIRVACLDQGQGEYRNGREAEDGGSWDMPARPAAARTAPAG